MRNQLEIIAHTVFLIIQRFHILIQQYVDNIIKEMSYLVMP